MNIVGNQAVNNRLLIKIPDHQGTDFDDMSSFFP